MMKMRSSSSSSAYPSKKSYGHRSSSKDLGSISEAPVPVSPSNDTTTVASDDDDEEIDFGATLERRDRSFLNSSVRKSPTSKKSVSSRSSSTLPSIRLLDSSNREKSLLTPQKQHSQVLSPSKFSNDGKGGTKPADAPVPKRSRSMVDGIKVKSSPEAASGRKKVESSDVKKARRPRSFVDLRSANNVRRSWFQKGKSQVESLLSSQNFKLPVEGERKSSLVPGTSKSSQAGFESPRSIVRRKPSLSPDLSTTSGSESTKESHVTKKGASQQLKSSNPRRERTKEVTQEDVKALTPILSPSRKASKIIKTSELKDEMKQLLHGKPESNREDGRRPLHNEQEAASRDQIVRPSPKRILSLSRVDSIDVSDSSENDSSSSQGLGERDTDEDLSASSSIAGMDTPPISNSRKSLLSSASPCPRPSGVKVPSKAARMSTSSRSSQDASSDAGSVSSSSQPPPRPRLSRIMQASPFSKLQRSSISSIDMGGSVHSAPKPPKHLPITEVPARAASPGFLRRLNLSFVKDDKKAPLLVESKAPRMEGIFAEAFYSSSHHRRTMTTRKLIWTSDRVDNFSDWILLVIRSGVSWETNNVDTYHIHKSVVGVGPRPSQLLLDQFEEQQESVYVRNTSSVELLSPAADLVPKMLDYVYNMKENPLKITTNSATALRYLADKFGVESMFQEVNTFIQGDMNEDTVESYYNDSVLFKDQQLIQATTRLMAKLEMS